MGTESVAAASASVGALLSDVDMQGFNPSETIEETMRRCNVSVFFGGGDHMSLMREEGGPYECVEGGGGAYDCVEEGGALSHECLGARIYRIALAIGCGGAVN